MMMDMAAVDSPSGSALKSVPTRCPFYTKSGALPSTSKTIVLQRSQQFIAALVSYPAVIAQAESRQRISFSRSRQKRGPPSLHS
jgi:hypothetical protein